MKNALDWESAALICNKYGAHWNKMLWMNDNDHHNCAIFTIWEVIYLYNTDIIKISVRKFQSDFFSLSTAKMIGEGSVLGNIF